jgi:hypothetical protein
MVMTVVQAVDEWVAGETEILEENLPQCRSVHHKFHVTWTETKSTVATQFMKFIVT